MSCKRAFFALAGMLVALPAFADKPYFDDTWTFRLGGMDQKADLVIASTLEGRPVRDLDFSDLGMDDNASTVWAGVTWQWADKWGASLSYSSFSTDGTETATEDGNFGDIEWTADAELDSEFDLDLYIFEVHWDFINTERSHLGVGLGLHVADISSSIQFTLTGTVNGQEVVLDSGLESASVTAPLPDLVLRAGHQFGDNFYLGFTGGWFSLTYEDIDGELLSAQATFEWRPAQHFGMGVGYQYVSVEITEDDGDRENEIDLDLYGPVLFLTVGF